MDITGDPNQRNNTSMFGFEGTYSNPTLDFSRFSAGVVSVSPSASSASSVENTPQCLSATNNLSPFPVNNSIRPTPNVAYNSGYVFPSTAALNMPSPANRFSFPLSQTLAPGEDSSSFLQSSSSFLENSIPANDLQHSIPFLGFPLNWGQNVKPTFTFPMKSTSSSSSSSGFFTKPLAGTFGCKRKTDSPPLPPLKQHITEERMAEHMSRLHISSQTPTSSNESEPVRERRLYMCEEMQRLQAESIIPAQILERVNRPCTALVPWRPPVVPPLAKENNNNEEEQDNNLMEESDSNGIDMES